MEPRREGRVKKEVWATVSGLDVLGNPFRVNTYTLDVSSHGLHLCRIPPLKGVGEVLEIQLQGRQAPCRVAWVGEPGTRLQGQIGLHCQERRPLFTEFGDVLPSKSLRPYLWLSAVIVLVVIVALGLMGYYLAGRYPASEPAPAQAGPSSLPSLSMPSVEAGAPQSGRVGFIVQVGAFENPQTAEALAQKLSGAYQRDVLVTPVQIGGLALNRVGISVLDKEEAEELARRISAEQRLETLVVPLR